MSSVVGKLSPAVSKVLADHMSIHLIYLLKILKQKSQNLVIYSLMSLYTSNHPKIALFEL
jgi:hypothetical protein